MSFHYRGVEGKSRKSRNTWSNRQILPWSTEWAGQKLIEFCQENALVIANTVFQQHKRQLYTWTSPDGQYWNQIDYILCSQRWFVFALYSQQKQDQELICSLDRQHIIVKFRLNLKKVGKTTRKTFRYDLNQILYGYTVEVTHRFKGLDLIDKVT